MMAPDETPAKEPNVLYSRQRMDLIIKECPADIAYEFFRFAEKKWGKKQWVALKDLLQIERQQSVLMDMAGRMGALEEMVQAHENLLSHVNIKIEESPKAVAEEKPVDKKPRTFGDD